MNRSKESRREVQERMSPLRHHSMNQTKSSAFHQGEERMRVDHRVRRQQKKLYRMEEEARASQLPYSAIIFTEAVKAVRCGDAPTFLTAYIKTHLDQFEDTGS